MTDAAKIGADYAHQHWEKQLKEIDLEIVRQAMLCEIPIGDRALMLRALENDATVCGTDNPEAFQKLRAALAMHLRVREKAIGSMGRDEALALIEEIVAGLRKRLGLPEKNAP
jgi:hypothetical protein